MLLIIGVLLWVFRLTVRYLTLGGGKWGLVSPTYLRCALGYLRMTILLEN